MRYKRHTNERLRQVQAVAELVALAIEYLALAAVMGAVVAGIPTLEAWLR